jgi:3',5'-cyclic-AMP phosphodiesterase
MPSPLRRLGWTTDIHLNFVTLDAWEAFIDEVRLADLDALLLTGDVSEAEDVHWQLRRLVETLDLPIYFVLGNHDFYHGSIAQVRGSVGELCHLDSRLHYLTARDLSNAGVSSSEPVLLAEGWVLCGEDGWADARVGDYYRSPVRMNDFRLIDDLKLLSSQARLRKLRRLGAESAVRLYKQMVRASRMGTAILVLTHIPPFRESCWYEGQQTNDDWAPFFVCSAAGWALKRFCQSHPEHSVTVLCGHTHHEGRAEMMSNLQVWTGRADYGKPSLCGVFELDDFRLPEPDWSYRAV